VFIESKSPHDTLPTGVIPLQEQIDVTDMNSMEMGNGTILALNQGETANAVNPGRPNTAFEGFIEAICKQIGTALEVPYELLLKRFDASYSAARASLLEAWKMFKMRREWLVHDLCQPVYETWLTEAVLKGRVIAPGFFDDPVIKAAYCRAEWHGPSQGQIDPLKEVSAAEKRVSNGFSNRAKEAQELTGTDFDSNIRLLKREQEQLREAGLITVKGGEKTNAAQ
jgi:lambda family phage portal protein